MLVSGAVATTALSSAFVASGPVAQEARTGLRSSGYAKSSQSSQSMGAMAGVGAVAGLAVAGVAGRRAGKNRTSMQAVGVGINGFGRIGRQVARIAMKDPETELKLINASYDSDYLAYMMKYDTIHGKYDGTVEVDGDSLVVDGQKIALSHTRDPAEIPFGEHGAEYVCESTGVFLTTEKVQGHLKAGAKKVIFSAPAKDDSHTIVMGVNEDTYEPSMECVVRVLRLLHHQRLGPSCACAAGEVGHQAWSHDHLPCHDCISAHCGWHLQEGLAWWPCWPWKHHPILHGSCQGCGQGDP